MLTLVRSIVSVLARRFRSRAVLGLENLALRHQLARAHIAHAAKPLQLLRCCRSDLDQDVHEQI
jgi:hypothetical protein